MLYSGFANIFKSPKCAAAEISYSKNQVEQNKEAVKTGITASTENNPEALDGYVINHNQIRTRLRHLECELNTALHSLRSKRECVFDEVCILFMHNSFYPVAVDSIGFIHTLQSVGTNKNTTDKACCVRVVNYYI